jgi:hypothetical protein
MQDDSVDDGLVLKDIRIAVRKIALTGWLYDDVGGSLNWSVDVTCEKHHFAEDWDLAPHFYDECFAKDLKDWADLAHRRFRPEDDEDEDSFPALYLCAHMSLPESEICFGTRDDGAGFDFSWRGLTDANLDEAYGKRMPFSIRGKAEVTLITVRFNEPESGMVQGPEVAARDVMQRRGVRHDHLAFSRWRRFRDDPNDSDFHTILAYFAPTGAIPP